MLSAHIRWYIPEYLERTKTKNYINLHPAAQLGRMKAIENAFLFHFPFSFNTFFGFSFIDFIISLSLMEIAVGSRIFN